MIFKKIFWVLVVSNLLQGCGGGNSSSTQNFVGNTNKFNTDIYVLGSSTMENMNSSLTEVANKNHYNLYNYAKGGEYLHSMCLRVGAFPGLVQFKNSKLIADTKNYFDADWPIDYSLKPFGVEINKIKGNISIDKNGYYFIFNTPFLAQASTNTYYPIQSLFPKIKSNSIFIVNLGKNNLLSNDENINSPNYIITKSEQCIDWISHNLTKKIIVIGFHTATSPSETLIKNTNMINDSLSNSYKKYFFDLKNYIESDGVWEDTQITYNKNDLDNQKKHFLPLSLAQDQIHLNEVTNEATSKTLIKLINNTF